MASILSKQIGIGCVFDRFRQNTCPDEMAVGTMFRLTDHQNSCASEISCRIRIPRFHAYSISRLLGGSNSTVQILLSPNGSLHVNPWGRVDLGNESIAVYAKNDDSGDQSIRKGVSTRMAVWTATRFGDFGIIRLPDPQSLPTGLRYLMSSDAIMNLDKELCGSRVTLVCPLGLSATGPKGQFEAAGAPSGSW
ncbi:hypothetical protein Pla52n_44820 [Stieleria varia]|uniref:Uncharacterized protein n=1 Tax=Stieleria varia TaxID=2528005 RepID=A0A5C6AN67_9BACT|nr:hypothetical protein Pla52n_44820 [Stieleria varia]